MKKVNIEKSNTATFSWWRSLLRLLFVFLGFLSLGFILNGSYFDKILKQW
ncbi:hypothetical protein [Lutimonas sp.]